MTKEELAYLAGFFDGEGCVTITWVKNMPGRLLVKIGNTNEHIIKLIGKWFKGSITHQKGKGNSKDSWHYQTCNGNAVMFLKAIYPHLLIKKEQAHMAFEYSKLIYMKGRGTNKIPEVVLNLRKKLFDQMHVLNHPGNNQVTIT